MTRFPTAHAIVQTADGWLRLEEPLAVIEGNTPEAVSRTLADVQRRARLAGRYAAGFVTYEAGAAFGLPVSPRARPMPLLWFALFDRAIPVPTLSEAGGAYELGALEASRTKAAFGADFVRIKERIACGDTYQVNYTFRLAGAFDGSAVSLFTDLVGAQAGRYSAFLDTGPIAICSASPELFFETRGGLISARPMKGTVRRGRTTVEDEEQRQALLGSPKQRAENVMIVDMTRNDLGRIARVGSVSVPELFDTERYPNVWQMTSLVTAEIDAGAGLEDLFAALHPAASVTGAPKVSTMGIIASLETEPRGVYTGAVGYVTPEGDARFNVAIRTAVVDREARAISFGVGSGIVWDSEAGEEYDECLLKASVLGSRLVEFELLETLRWTPDEQFFLLAHHLQRMGDSAAFFGMLWSEHDARRVLDEAVCGQQEPRRIRMLLSRDGAVRVEQGALQPPRDPVQVRLAADPIDPADPFYFHKTTRRGEYDRRRLPDCDDVVLWNPSREITESTIANVVVEVDGRRLTPPLACGLLQGTYRAVLLERGEIEEGVITVDALRRAERLWLINSVQQWRRAVLIS